MFVCVWLDSNKAYGGAFRAAFSLLLGERMRESGGESAELLLPIM